MKGGVKSISGQDAQIRKPDMAKVLPILHKISIFGGLTEPQLVKVLDHMHSVRYRAGETLFVKGDSAHCIYVIHSGRVKIVAGLDCSRVKCTEYQEGDCFGERSAIGILPHMATAVAIADTELLILPMQGLHDIYHQDPALFGILILNIAREACRRLYKSDQLFLQSTAG
jgi:CRP-like cAMP-binding protein